jgi:hypothetical protein
MHTYKTHTLLKNQGITLVTALTFIMVTMILVGVTLTTALSNRSNAADALRSSQAQFAAETGLDVAMVRVWHNLADSSNVTFASYDTSLRGIGLAPNTSISKATNDPSITGASYTYTVTRAADTVVGGRVQSINLTAVSTGTLNNGTTRILEQRFSVRRGFFPFDFALLTNNVDCVFCHVDVKSMDALKTPTPSAATPWSKAKIGVLESIVTRTTNSTDKNTSDFWFNAAGNVAGSVYTRGTVQIDNWGSVSNGVTASLRSNLVAGNTQVTSSTYNSVSPVDCSISSNCLSNRTMYYNYPKSTNLAAYNGRWPDGNIPDEFPLPIADTNANRIIDNTEWSSTVTSSIDGTNLDYPAGTLSANMTVYTGTGGTAAWGGTSRSIDTDDLASTATPNDVIMDGNSVTISVNGTVYINGDVYIRGWVKGSGTILARNNIYILGDIKYDCTDTQNSKACNYANADTLPKLNLISGGNIVAGDPFASQRRQQSELNSTNAGYQRSFTSCRVYQSNTSANPEAITYNGQQENCGKTSWDGTEPNLPMRETAAFNRNELEKAVANSSYVPRFYRFYRDDDRNGVLDTSVWIARGCTSTGNNYINDYAEAKPGNTFSAQMCKTNNGTMSNQTATQMNAIFTRAVIQNVEPARFGRGAIRALWKNSIYDTGRAESEFRTDGLLYSSNSIFSIQSHRGKTRGQWDIRGAIVSADTAILASGRQGDDFGLRVYHDSRMRPRLPQETALTLSRGIWKVKSQ